MPSSSSAENLKDRRQEMYQLLQGPKINYDLNKGARGFLLYMPLTGNGISSMHRANFDEAFNKAKTALNEKKSLA